MTLNLPDCITWGLWRVSGQDMPSHYEPSPRLWLDLDGCFADFDGFFVNKLGVTPTEFESNVGSKKFWGWCKQYEVYKHLKPMNLELFESLRKYRPTFLTGAPGGRWAEAQKIHWVIEHFPGTPVMVCMARDKHKFCQQGDVLIDDRTKYAQSWKDAGGHFVHYSEGELNV